MANKPARPDLAPRRPSAAELPEAADQWVHGNDTPATPAAPAPPAAKPPEAKARLTLDIPASLHFAMKMRATATGVAMVDEVTPLLMTHYADDLKRYQRG